PDVTLMDAVMPGTDGFETCRRLKQNRALAHVPVIFMTGLTDSDHIIEGLEAGGVDYVTKPIVPGELLARIRVHLANARLAHSARAALDVFGPFLLAGRQSGPVLWGTPPAGTRLAAASRDFDTERYVLPAAIRDWLAQRAGSENSALAPSIDVKADDGSEDLQLFYVGQIGADEHLLRLVEGEAGNEQSTLRQK